MAEKEIQPEGDLLEDDAIYPNKGLG